MANKGVSDNLTRRVPNEDNHAIYAVVVKSVEAADLKSAGGDTIRVRFPSAAPSSTTPLRLKRYIAQGSSVINSAKRLQRHYLLYGWLAPAFN